MIVSSKDSKDELNLENKLSSEKFCSVFPQISEEMEKMLIPFIKIRQVKKNTMYIAKGELPTEFAFCFKELFRYYYIDYQGEDYTKHFASEGKLITSLLTLF